MEKIKNKKKPYNLPTRWYNQQFPRWVFENQALFITINYYKKITLYFYNQRVLNLQEYFINQKEFLINWLINKHLLKLPSSYHNKNMSCGKGAQD